MLYCIVPTFIIVSLFAKQPKNLHTNNLHKSFHLDFALKVWRPRLWLQCREHSAVDLNAPGGLWEVWLQWCWLSKAADLRGPQGWGLLRRCLQEAPEWIRVSKLLTFAMILICLTKISILWRLAKYLEVLNMPDEFRELLDEYMDASERSLGQKECTEFFQCPYSLKDSVKRNFSGNSL